MSGREQAEIDIVIPNWNGRAMLQNCLASLQRQSVRNFRVIVVDNGSTDDSLTFIGAEYPWANIVSLPENKGFSAAVNAGILAGECPWVLLLNNDTELHPDCIHELSVRCRGQDTYDLFALKMCAFAQRNLIDGAGDGVLRGGVGYRLGTMEVDGPDFSLSKEVFGACAGAALYRRSLFDRIGLFDETFFAYLEDVDFNMRAVRAGASCSYLPQAVVYHIGSASSGSKVNEFVIRLSTRNNIFVIFKNYTPRLLLRFLPALLVYQWFWLLFVIKKKQFGAYLSGLYQALPMLSTMMRRRKENMARSRLTDQEFAERIIDSERQVLQSIMSRREQQGKGNRALQLYRWIFC